MKLVIPILALIGAVGASFSFLGTAGGVESIEIALGESAHLAIELGLDPATLAVAGFDDESAEALLARLAAETTLRSDLVGAHSTAAQATAALTVAAEQVALNPADVELRAAYASAQQAAAAANAQVAALRAELLEAALEGVAPSQVAALQTCCALRGCAIAPAMKALPHSPAEAVELETCLVAEARGERRDEALDPAMARRLAEVRSEMDVIVAGQRLATHLAAIEAVFARN